MAIIRGTSGNDNLKGGTASDTIYGEAGNDTLDGGAGNDILYGGAGTDTLIGGAGNDTLDGGTGLDSMRGGIGDDLYIVDNASDAIVENANEGIDLVRSSVSFTLGNNIERLEMTSGANIDAVGNALNNILIGHGGNNVITGMDGNDAIWGSGGDDTLLGGNGNDYLEGGWGKDTLTGGAGNDTFGFGIIPDSPTVGGWDVITDFTQGQDKIDVSNYLGATNLAWGGTMPTVNGVWYAKSGKSTFIYADVDGNGAADIRIELQNTANLVLQASDFQGVAAPANSAPVITSPAAYTVNENGTAIGTVTATDADGNTLVYSIVGGADAAKFTINAATGTLSFVSAPDFEAPTDAGGNNVYDLQVRVSDGISSTQLAIAVTVANVNDNAPVITSSASFTVNENATAVGTVSASDADGGNVTYAITGGADQALFTVNATTGALAFVNSPDYENPVDAGGNNVYDVIVTASDGTNSTPQAIAITIANLNDNGVILADSDPTANSVAENATNGTAVGITVQGTDADAGTTVTYTLSDDAGGRFAIDATTGVVTVANGSLLDYETATSHAITVLATSSDGSIISSNFTIAVGNANDNAPVVTSPAAYTVNENTTAVGTVTATDADGNSVSYAITGGGDAALFAIDASTGELSFVVAPDYEVPADVGVNNVYDVIVTASDGTHDTQQAIAVTVADQNDAVPVFTSPAAFTINENATAVGTVAATDADSGMLTYAITGGADAALFAIDANTGELSFVSPPDYENPADAGAGNVYDVIVTASDGTNDTSQNIAITVNNVNDSNIALVDVNISPNAVAENAGAGAVVGITALGTDPDSSATVTYSLTDDASGRFAIDSATGVVTVADGSLIDYETTTSHSITVLATSSDGSTASENFTVAVTNVNDNAPLVTSAASYTVNENTTAVGVVAATDADGDAVIYAITGGADATLFAIDAATGALSFVSAPDHEAPTDAGGNNVYDVIVTASDGTNDTPHNIAVTVANSNDNSIVLVDSNSSTNSVAENATSGTAVGITAQGTDADAGTTVTYTLTDDAGGRFVIDNATGVVTVANGSLLDHEAATSHIITVLAMSSDGSAMMSNFDIAVTNENDNAPVITSLATYTATDNSTAVGTITATDADGDALGFSIIGGVDAALFAIDSSTGELSFVTAPDFEVPTDSGADNVYDVIISASDGANSTMQAVAITVTNVNDNAPVITSPTSYTADENITAVGKIAASDADGDTVTYSISGGADAALFALDAATGDLSFVTAPDHENPTDAGGDNVYDVIVAASDGINNTPQAISVTVQNINDNAPVISSSADLTVAENINSVGTIAATDADGGSVSYAVTGGADAAHFAIDSSTGVLSFVSAPDYESPTDSGADNVYDVTVTASDGTNDTSQNLAITVSNANDNGVVLADVNAAINSVAENADNGTMVGIAALGTDADAGATVSYNLTDDAGGRFAINASTGIVTVANGSLLDYEAATSHTITVLATSSDGSTASENFTIDIANASDNAPNIENGSISLAEDTVAGSNVFNVNDSFTGTDLDRDGDAITYSITTGNDDGIFAIDASTGQITIAAGKTLDYETAQSHALTVTASDGSLSDTAMIAVNVTNVNDIAPNIENGSADVIENPSLGSIIYDVNDSFTLSDVDREGNAITYSITAGNDEGIFEIEATTGHIKVADGKSLDYESDTNHTLTVAASDGLLSDTADITFNVLNLNDNGVTLADSNTAANTASENAVNGAVVGITALGTDADAGATVSYSLTDNAGGRFAINASSGVVTVANGSLLDYESAQSHTITVLATSSDGSSTSGNFTIAIANANDNPLEITSASSFSINENNTSVATVATNDADGGAPLYFLIGGGDAALFNIDMTTGELSFKNAPNFEAPADAGGNNVYDVKVVAVDGMYYDMQDIAITVNNVNEFAPAISTGAAFSIAENSTAVTTVAATDGDNDSITYSISGGADASLFSIDSSSGALSFASAPDSEAPTDVGANNVYDVIVMASDGELESTKAIAVTVTNVNDNAPVITTAASVTAPENSTAAVTLTSTDADNIGTRTYSIAGGADAALFNINASSGAVTFKTAQNYEAPNDAGANGVYDISVRVSDGTLSSTKDIAISLTNVNEAPVAVNSVAETNLNTALSGTVTASDVDNANSELTTTLVTGPLHGTVTFGPNQTYTYTPTAGYWGGDSFTFNVKDPGNLASNTGTVSINVAGMSDTGEFVANTYTTNAQFGETDFQDTMAALSDGGFVSLWVSNNQDGAQYGVFGQRFDASGNKLGSEFQVNSTTSNNQHYASVTGLAGGGFVATWGSYGQVGAFNFEVYAQRFDASGNKVGTEFLVNTIQANNYDQYRSSIAGLSGGGFVVTWDSMGQDAIGTTGIYGQRFDASGNKVGTEFLVNTTIAGSQTSSSVASLLNDGYVVTWASPDANGSGIYGQRFNGSGAKVGGEFLVNTTTTGAQTNANVHAFSDGGFIVTWTSPDASGTGIYAQRFDAAGVKAGVEFLVNSTTAGSQSLSSADVLSDGGFIVTWTSNEPDGTTGIYAQRFDAGGVKVGGEFHVNSTMTGTQSISEVVGLKNGGFAVDWTSDQTNPGGVDKDVYVKVFSDLPGPKSLVGTSANDALMGGALNDVLTGFGGNDTLAGLGGNDTFVYRLFTDKGTTGDVITDFSKGGPNGTDLIDLSAMLDTFAGYNGSNAFTGGYLQFIASGNDTLMQVDIDGGGDNFVTVATLVGVTNQADMASHIVV